MYLVTLGRMALADSSFRRQKPLLLLSFLSLEGPRPRRYLAELFWPGASDNLNSLSVALSQIRRGTDLQVESDEQHIWVRLGSDAADLLQAVNAGDVVRARQLYRGPFLEAAEADLGEELEEWIFQFRERLAGEHRSLLLRQAEAQAALGMFRDANQLAEEAWQLPGAAPLEPEDLPRIHRLLVAGGSALSPEVGREADEYGLELPVDAELAKTKLRQPIIGRDHELKALAGLAAGEWAWLQGGSGMGKTTLLRATGGTYLPARAGLPYATLEPLIGDTASNDAAGLRSLLRQLDGVWLVDDWDRIDDASREMLLSLRDVHIHATVIVSSTGPPPFPVELQLTLGPLPREVLVTLEQGWERTGGLPPLVAAVLNQQSVEAALESLVSGLTDDARRFMYGISLLDQPDPVIVRRALALPATVTAAALESLRNGGLLDAAGHVRARASLHELMKRDPAASASVALSLARALPPAEAFDLWLAARPLWEDTDRPAVMEAALKRSEALLERGFPMAAAEVLQKAPASTEVRLMRARAYERAGQYRTALKGLEDTPDDPSVAAVRAAALFRLGQADEARRAANLALSGTLEDRAWGQNTLGLLDFAAGELDSAASAFRRTAALWTATGRQLWRADALNNLAVVTSELGGDGLALFRKAAELADGNSAVLSRVRLNMARVLERGGQVQEAFEVLKRAAELSRETGDVATAARIFNNMGALKHRQGKRAEAEAAYSEAIELAGQAGEKRLLAVSLANQAELEQDFEAWEEALRLFSAAGFDPDELIEELPADHPFRGRSGAAA